MAQTISLKTVGYKKPSKNDLLWSLIGTIALLALATGISLLAGLLNPELELPYLQAPQKSIEWLVMILESFSTGYVEETFFRVYLLQRFKEYQVSLPVSSIISILLFSLCHLYEGPLGLLNATIGAIILTFLYLKTGSVHTPAWAHGLYNCIVYATGI
jgi:membrane protease YdiL (CAAX protease family)